MRTSNLFWRLARADCFPKLSRARTRRNRRITSRYGPAFGLEHLEDRTLLASVTITELVGPFSWSPSINGDGTKIAFHSANDLVGRNGDFNYEIFLYDTATGDLSQVSDVPGPAAEGHSVDFPVNNVDPTISGDGTKIAYRLSTLGASAVYLFDTSINHSTLIAGGNSGGASLNYDGTKIAFSSTLDFTGENADGNREVFLYDAAVNSYAQVTVTSGAQNGGIINSDGTRIAIASNANLTGNNADLNWEIFLFDIASGGFKQVTDTIAGETNGGPSISSDGNRIAFHSNADFTGENPEENYEIFLFDAAASSLTQVTDGGEGSYNGSASLSSDGTRIAFQSNETIVFLDVTTSGSLQVTDYFALRPSLSGDGTRIAFDSPGVDSSAYPGIYLAAIADAEPVVEGVYLFYNNSALDGNGTDVTPADFNAIATDKSPLAPGGMATFANVSGYSQGITGVFLDVSNLPHDGADLDGSDLWLAVGDNDFPDSWTRIAPMEVGVFPNAGPGGADRIYVTFADGAIVDTWLEITLLPTLDTGLPDEVDFFYGSVPGETGAAFTGQGEFFGRDAADLQAIAANLFRPADIANPHDVNRDGTIDAFDFQVIATAVGGIDPNVIHVLAKRFEIGQLTHTAEGFGSQPAAISSDGTKVAFRSREDLTGHNADGNLEIFLLDLPTGSFTQVTDTTAGESGAPSINSDGTRVAFESTANLTGNNSDGRFEIFLFDATTKTLAQLTDGGSDSRAPSINADGTKIAFESNSNLVGMNPGGGREVFLFDTTANHITQVTVVHDSARASDAPSISSDGTRIAFRSSANLVGMNSDVNREIFYYDVTTSSFTQVTNTTTAYGFDRRSSISGDGTKIAFSRGEVFLYDTLTGSLTQLTDGHADSLNPSINSDGTRIVFQSTGNLSGRNGDRNYEIFLFDTTIGAPTQLTDSTVPGGSFTPAINGDGARLTLQSTADLIADDIDGSGGIYLVTTGDGDLAAQPVPAAGLALAAVAVDEVMFEDSAAGGVAVPPTNDGLGDMQGPVDGRLGGEDVSERQIAFATFAAETAEPFSDALLARLAVDALTL